MCGIVLILIALMLGTTIITPEAMVNNWGNGNSTDYNILANIRIPRILMSLVIGASLSISGMVFQALLRNSLADPYIIGVSSGGALGATIAIVLSLASAFIVGFAFTGSLFSVSAVYLISKRLKLGTTSLILSGVALGFIFSSAVLLIFAIAKSNDVHRAIMWLMGDLTIARYEILLEMTIVSFVLILIIVFYWKHLNVISFGDTFSKNLGVSKSSLKILFWAASLLAAVSVSLCGVIGFIGLIVPHVMRGIIGPDHKKLLPASAFGGAVFLMSADTIGRSIAPPYEIPVGIITGFCGGIFFLLFILRKRKFSL